VDTKIRLWGNSLAVRIPKAFAEEVGLDEDSNVEISVEGKTITIRPMRNKYTLEELLKGITPGNRHELVDWGPPVGREIW
jgi:Growth regulator